MSVPTDTNPAAPDAAMRTLAALLPCGVLLLGPDARPQFASAHACALLGAADEAQLCARWDALAAALCLGDPAALPVGAQVMRAGRAIEVDAAPRALRIEVHATGARSKAHYVVLLQRRDRHDSADAALIAASRAEANQHVLAGLLHELNGPLNNLNLTLALLTAALARIVAQQPGDSALERCRRHVDTLNAEIRRLSECSRAMSGALGPPDESSGVAPVAPLLHEVQRVLRHHAMLHELSISMAEPPADLCMAGDIGLLRLALLDLVLTALGITAPGGEIMVTSDDDRGALHLRIVARRASASADAFHATDNILAVPSAEWLGFVAARRILELHGGGAALRAEARDTLAIEARLPLHRA